MLASTTLDISFSISKNEITQGSQQTFDLDDTNKVTFTVDDMTVTIEQRIIDEEKIAFAVCITQHDEIFSQPYIVAQWNMPASVTIGNGSGESYSLSIIPHKN